MLRSFLDCFVTQPTSGEAVKLLRVEYFKEYHSFRKLIGRDPTNIEAKQIIASAA